MRCCADKPFFKSLNSCDLENDVKVTKISSVLSSHPVMYLYKFDLNPFILSGDSVKKSNTATSTDADADEICTENK